jgi:hypothetical protein
VLLSHGEQHALPLHDPAAVPAGDPVQLLVKVRGPGQRHRPGEPHPPAMLAAKRPPPTRPPPRSPHLVDAPALAAASSIDPQPRSQVKGTRRYAGVAAGAPLSGLARAGVGRAQPGSPGPPAHRLLTNGAHTPGRCSTRPWQRCRSGAQRRTHLDCPGRDGGVQIPASAAPGFEREPAIDSILSPCNRLTQPPMPPSLWHQSRQGAAGGIRQGGRYLW